jgi:acetyl-CoA C-acetyltransferase
MEGIKDKVAIIGMGCTKFGENWDQTVEDMIVEAVYEAYQDAGVDRKDIQAGWWGTCWAADTAQAACGPTKLAYIPFTRVENACATGTESLRGACYAVAAGAVDIAIAIGAEKLKDTGYMGLPQFQGYPSWSWRWCSETAPSNYAMMATGYFAKNKISMEEGKKLLAQISVKNHHNGALSPKAHFQKEVTLEQVLKAPIIAYPLGLLDCCGVSDGAAAAIVCRADMAKKFRPDPIYIKSIQISQGPREGYLSQVYDYAHVEETRRASAAAYREAGIKNPREEISCAEVHDCFTITELTIYEDMQFSPIGKAREDIEAGTFALKGKLPINPDGGLKCFGHPVGASGLRMMYEMYKQLQGKAGPRQTKNPRIGLTHNQGGAPGAATVSVAIVGNDLG